jgi:hypothetical protein
MLTNLNGHAATKAYQTKEKITGKSVPLELGNGVRSILLVVTISFCEASAMLVSTYEFPNNCIFSFFN